MNAFLQAVEYRLANKETEEAVLKEIASDAPISATLYSLYSQTLRKAIDDVFEPGNELADRLRANVTRFSAYKAYHATSLARKAEEPKGVLQRFNRYLAAEYNTTAIRAHRAADWQQFEAERDVLPNLEWMPSTSINPGEDHRTFWGTTLPIDDPFWEEHCPGDRWNCKCHLRNTDKEPTDRPTSDNPCDLRHDGLEGNPAHTGEVFSDNANYIRTLNRSDVNIGQKIVKFYRDNLRSKYETTSINIDTDFGYILIDNITIQEITKGAKTEKSFFYKQEIVQNIEHYIKQMVLIDGHETIDLSHNNHRSIYYQRKKLFTHMEVYRLDIGVYSYCIKFGVFRNEEKNLYCITEPDW